MIATLGILGCGVILIIGVIVTGVSAAVGAGFQVKSSMDQADAADKQEIRQKQQGMIAELQATIGKDSAKRMNNRKILETEIALGSAIVFEQKMNEKEDKQAAHEKKELIMSERRVQRAKGNPVKAG